MNSLGRLAVVVVVAVAAGCGGYWFARHHAGDGESADKTEPAATTQSAEEEPKPVVPVVTAPLKRGTITETAAAYGTVVAEAADVRVVSVPYEARVGPVPVTPGQHVAAGAEVAQVEASPDTLVAMEEARNAVASTAADLKLAQQRYADHLATNSDLSAAKVAAQSAELKLKSFTDRGVGAAQRLRASVAGIVSKVDVQEGQIVPAGGPLVELAAGNRIEVRLWVDPASVRWLKVGQPIRIRQVGGGEGSGVDGKVRLIARRVDPSTRMVEARVTLPEGAAWMLDAYVVGDVTRSAPDALVVPRDAALPGEDGNYAVYTTKDGRAVKHEVKIGLQSGDQVQVICDDLKAGEPIVVVGNYLLADGMPVDVKDGTGEEPASEPTSQPAREPVIAPAETGGKS